MLKPLWIGLTICLLLTACQPVSQNPSVVASAANNDKILPTAASISSPQIEGPSAKAQGDSSSARTAESRSFIDTQADTMTPTVIPSPTATLTPEPTASPTPTPCAESQGTVITGQLKTDLLPAPLNFRVYLPPCYTIQPPVRYPVLYLLHGMNNDDQQWVKIGAPTAADALIENGKAPPFLIVMPQEDNWSVNADDTNYGKAVVTALVPWIDQNYATCTDRLCRAIGGLSRGSGWAIRLGFSYPDVFGAIGAHSLSPFDGDYDKLPNWLGAIPPASAPQLYLDMGNVDISLEYAKYFEAEITRLNFVHEWHIFEGGHNEAYWSAHIMDYLKWYTQPWMGLSR
jgi:enterochelin esterase-like enzyme